MTKIVASKAKVDRVASNRRVPQPDGSIAVRASVTREAAVRDAPEGLIDPWLRTLTFFDDDRKLVQLHYYATHLQTFYGDSRVPSPPPRSGKAVKDFWEAFPWLIITVIVFVELV